MAKGECEGERDEVGFRTIRKIGIEHKIIN